MSLKVSLPSRMCFGGLDEHVFSPNLVTQSLERTVVGILLLPCLCCSTCSPFLHPLQAVVRGAFPWDSLVSSSLGKDALEDFSINTVAGTILVRNLG